MVGMDGFCWDREGSKRLIYEISDIAVCHIGNRCYLSGVSEHLSEEKITAA